MTTKNTSLLLPFFALLAITSCAHAQELSSKNSWSYNVGLGVMSLPSYPGSDERKTKAVPVVSGTNGHYFFGTVEGGPTVPFGGGMYLYKNSVWSTGIAAAYDIYSPRSESDDEAHLKGLGDIEKAAHLTWFGRYSRDWYSGYGQLTGSTGGQGFQLKMGATGRYEITPKLAVSGGPSFTWSSTTYNQTFFGVSAAQSAKSGLAQYTATSGISDVSLSIGTAYQISPKWSVNARVGVSYLPSNVSDSPIVEKTTSINFGLYTGYRF